ncbi:arsenic resistance protein [Salinicoccus luteus]|uniref:arsenic resistance protein n=1 Tax=Salinicoccus luteus TaxID=367840 RepID=UPI0004E16C9D|nr:arsenic resistance protein [Salinicoccus luteus]
MNSLEKYQPLILLIAILMGMLLGGINTIQQHAGTFIVPFLMLMLYGLFLLMPLKRVFTSFRKVKFVLVSLGINFLWTPFLAYAIGMVFLSDHPLIWIGFVMLTVTPCTDWYLVFTGLAKGDTVLSASLLPINLVLQLILLPAYLYLFFGFEQGIGLSFSGIIQSVLIVVGIPFVLALLTKRFLPQQSGVEGFFDTFNVIFLGLAVTAMFAAERDTLLENSDVVLLLLPPLLLFFVITFVVGNAAGRLFRFNQKESVSLVMMTLARNSPLALAIAITAFPEHPLIALSLVIGPIIELPILGLASRILLAHK